MSDCTDNDISSTKSCAACATSHDRTIGLPASLAARRGHPALDTKRLIASTLCLIGLAACSGTAEQDPANDQRPVQLLSADPQCQSQRAVVPSSSVISSSFMPDSGQVLRTDMSPDYVSYNAEIGGTRLYISFAASLPASPSTAEARAAFGYAWAGYDYVQPAAYGGSLTLVSTNDPLVLSDFDRFEVVAGALRFRLVRNSGIRYSKLLSSYDEDKTNDPPNPETCTGGGDIQGLCSCEFSGPDIQVTLEGSLPL